MYFWQDLMQGLRLDATSAGYYSCILDRFVLMMSVTIQIDVTVQYEVVHLHVFTYVPFMGTRYGRVFSKVYANEGQMTFLGQRPSCSSIRNGELLPSLPWCWPLGPPSSMNKFIALHFENLRTKCSSSDLHQKTSKLTPRYYFFNLIAGR